MCPLGYQMTIGQPVATEQERVDIRKKGYIDDYQ